MSEEIDYTALDGPSALRACGHDASKWATCFCQHAAKYQGLQFDEGLMITWFANAMMAMHDHLRPECAPVVLPDGSAFFVADVEI